MFKSTFDETSKPRNMSNSIKILSVTNITKYDSNEIVIATIKVRTSGEKFLSSCIIYEILIIMMNNSNEIIIAIIKVGIIGK